MTASSVSIPAVSPISDSTAFPFMTLPPTPFFAQPIAVLDSGDMSTANDDGGIRTEPYIENSNYELPRGLRVYRGDFDETKLALGGTKMNFAAGSYSANYSLSFDGVFCADDAVLATAKVKNAEGAEVATKDITKADLTRSIKDSNGGNTTGGFFDGTIDLAVPFTVEADGEYTAELYTTDLPTSPLLRLPSRPLFPTRKSRLLRTRSPLSATLNTIPTRARTAESSSPPPETPTMLLPRNTAMFLPWLTTSRF